MKIAFILSLIATILLFIFDSVFFIPMIFCAYLLYCLMVDEDAKKKVKKKTYDKN